MNTLEKLIKNTPAKYVVLSYNNNGRATLHAIIEICDRCGNAMEAKGRIHLWQKANLKFKTEEENLYHELETTHKVLSLCEICWGEFKGFWEGKLGGDPNNPFPLRSRTEEKNEKKD